jgi:hypothetical protein
MDNRYLLSHRCPLRRSRTLHVTLDDDCDFDGLGDSRTEKGSHSPVQEGFFWAARLFQNRLQSALRILTDLVSAS